VADEPGRLGEGYVALRRCCGNGPVDARFEMLPRIAAEDHLTRRLLHDGLRGSSDPFFIPVRQRLGARKPRATGPAALGLAVR